MIQEALYDTAIFLIKTLPIVAFASYLISYSFRRGYIEKLSRFLSPLIVRFRLSEMAILSISTCFLSPTASYSILAQAWRENKISRREVIALSLLNSLPSAFSHLYTFFIPFVIPILGFAGLIYTLIRLLTSLIKSFLGYFLSIEWRTGHLPKSTQVSSPPSENLVKVALIMATTYFLVSLFIKSGLLNFLPRSLELLPLPSESLMISAVSFLNARMAVVFAAGFQNTGLSWKWIVIGLVLGNVITLSARSIRHSLPMHMSLFGKFGLKIVLINSSITLLLDLIFIAIIYYI